MSNKLLQQLSTIVLVLSFSIASNAQCINIPYTAARLSEDDFGQSFTMPASGCGGQLASVSIFKDDDTPDLTNTTVSLYAGEQVGGTPLYTQSGITITGSREEKNIPLGGGTGSLALSAGQQYTIYFQINQITFFEIGQEDVGEIYAGGKSYFIGGFYEDFDLYLRVFTNPPALPVELVSFEAQQQKKAVTLTWQTSSEQNNAGFEVQRSADGKEWKNLGFVEGYGTISELMDYRFIDDSPLPVFNYYRLKQMDFDGAYEYSDIVKTTNYQNFSIYPNPAQDELHIIGTKGLATIYNMLGQEINTFKLKDKDASISLSNLPKGNYYLELVQADGQKMMQQFIKQ